ncbi:MAG: hypothetical protein L6Q35_07940 [Phycisphaerales bacterium]|nr:hypothetical protein [Phycisphaerales bacterium]
MTRPARSTGSARGRAARRGAARAFTLVEVVLVLALVIAVLGGVASLSERVMEHRARSRAWMTAQETAELVIGTLDRELATCTAGDEAFGAGVSGNGGRIRVVSRGVLGVEGDQIVTELRFDAATRTVTGKRLNAGSIDQSEMVRIGGGLEAMRLLYRSSEEWVESFDSNQRGSLPAAVQVELWFTSAGGSSSVAGGSVDTQAPAPGFPQRPADRVRIIAIPDAVEQADEQVAGVGA